MIQCLKRKAFQEKVRIRFCVGMEMGYVSTFFFCHDVDGFVVVVVVPRWWGS